MSPYGKAFIYMPLGLRWLLLSIGVLLYSRSAEAGNAGVLWAAVGLQAICAIAWLSKRSGRYAAAAIAADLLFQVWLLKAAGGLSGPLTLYSLSGLIMLKRYMGWRSFYAVSLAYMLALPAALAWLDGSAPDVYIVAHGSYVAFVALFCGAAAAAHGVYGPMKAHLRKLAALYSFGELGAGSEPGQAIRSIEALLKRILDRRDVWLCVDASGSSVPNISWMHDYYANSLQRHPSLPAAGNYLRLVSPVGEAISLYARTWRDSAGESCGWLLIEAQPGELSMLQRAYAQLALSRFAAYCDLNRQLGATRERAVSLERDSIAQKIHDGIAQELFFYSVQLYQIKSTLQRDDSVQALSLVTEMEKKIKDSHREIRKFIVELKGEKRRFNLLDAIEKMLRRITEHTGIRLEFENIGRTPRERVEFEETIYHFIEEAANNVVKHAAASRLQVRLEVTSVQWTIVVQDNGRGMREGSEAASKDKFGLRGMAGRIKGLSGTLSIQSEAERGTTITAAIPRERGLAHV